ncbi:methyltransferase, FxLD system [Solwaraspora sp. WMMA2065]|uniref:methyltransferase, FxLD system n=1 Tax=Solwaraspora sp. WMMA2065 TaxID=3015166 RepID=UPI00259B1B89|nr:methyltransferase, FxLD system [Solwaraspora sp. WMMA2065]WJK33094.1 methyltransferase, FxLD system [Solwaraspora sp. WMMA2065]
MTVTGEMGVGDQARLRAAMVAELREDVIVSDAVAAAFSTVPRHLFAAGEPLEAVYDSNTPLVTKVGSDGAALSSVSAAHIQAVMLEQAGIEPGMRVLEIGSGGYNAALIAELVGPKGSVTSVDIDAEIVARARRCLRSAGYGRVRVVRADAEHGVPEHAPYDRIIVTVGAWDIPPAWIHQLSGRGRIVVPLRFAGLSRCVAFDRVGTRLVSRSYCLGGFVPMQGQGTFTDTVVPVTGDAALRVDGPDPGFDVPALRGAIHGRRIARWSGAAFDLPDELELFVVTSGPLVPFLHASQALVDRGVFTPAVTVGAAVLVEAGSFAYRTKRGNEDTGGWESGVYAHGPNAEDVAERYLDLLRRWAAGYRRRGAARIEYIPGDGDGGTPRGWCAPKRHGVVAVSWP